MSNYFKVFWDGAGFYAPTSSRDGMWGQEYTAYTKMSSSDAREATSEAYRCGYGAAFWVDRESEIVGDCKQFQNSDLYVD